jgi:hypothetical protein
LATATLAAIGLGWRSFGPVESHHRARPRGRHNDRDRRDECQNLAQPKHNCSIFEAIAAGKLIFELRLLEAAVLTLQMWLPYYRAGLPVQAPSGSRPTLAAPRTLASVERKLDGA